MQDDVLKVDGVCIGAPGCMEEYIPGGIYSCMDDERCTVIKFNKNLREKLSGIPEDTGEWQGRSFWEFVHPEDREACRISSSRQYAQDGTAEVSYRLLDKNNTFIWVLDKARRVCLEDGRRMILGVLLDFTEIKNLQDELKQDLDRYRIVIDQMEDVVFEWELASDCLTFSSNWKKKFGDIFAGDSAKREEFEQNAVYHGDFLAFKNCLGNIAKGAGYQESELRLKNADGTYGWYRVRLTAQQGQNGQTAKGVGILIDIDREKREALRLIEIAQRDTLTGLYNKGAAQKLISEGLENTDRGNHCVLMIIDVDDFKHVNDSMGHLFGDAFLTEIAKAIRSIFRADDIVGRIGGDEFIVGIIGIENISVIEEKAEKLRQLLSETAEKTGEEVRQTSCSIGIAYSPEHGVTYQELYRRADHALYQAKSSGKNRCVFFDGRMRSPYISKVSGKIDDQPEEDNDRQGNVQSGQLESAVFHILYESYDISKGIQTVLEMVGQYFEVSRVYIFENSQDNLYCSNTYEWCSQGIVPQKELLQHVSYEEDMGGGCQEFFNEDGVFYCKDILELDESQYELLVPQGIKSMLLCAIKDRGRFRGYVGFDECRSNRFWNQRQIDSLTRISEVLSVFLLKDQAEKGQAGGSYDV